MSKQFVQRLTQLTWGNYNIILVKRPFLTQSITTGVIMVTGDVIAQMAFSPLERFDFKRSLKFFTIGTFVIGPWLRIWFTLLNTHVPGSGATKTIKMVCIDQICMSPTFIFSFMSIYGALNGESVSQIKQNLQRDFKTVLINNYKVWPFAQFVNFYLVPLRYRVLFSNLVGLMWNTYLSYAFNAKSKT